MQGTIVYGDDVAGGGADGQAGDWPTVVLERANVAQTIEIPQNHLTLAPAADDQTPLLLSPHDTRDTQTTHTIHAELRPRLLENEKWRGVE